MTVNEKDLQKAIGEEITKFLEEHRSEIVKRALEKLKKSKEAEANEPKVK